MLMNTYLLTVPFATFGIRNLTPSGCPLLAGVASQCLDLAIYETLLFKREWAFQ